MVKGGDGVRIIVSLKIDLGVRRERMNGVKKRKRFNRLKRRVRRKRLKRNRRMWDWIIRRDRFKWKKTMWNWGGRKKRKVGMWDLEGRG